MIDPVTIYDGKYTFFLDDKGLLDCLRHGEPWPAFRSGDGHFKGYVLALYHEILRLRKLLANVLAAEEQQQRHASTAPLVAEIADLREQVRTLEPEAAPEIIIGHAAADDSNFHHVPAVFKLISCPEGEFNQVYEFPSIEARDAFSDGFTEGCCQYGCGAVYLFPWELLEDAEAFGREAVGLEVTLHELRKLVGWKSSDV